MVLEGNAMVITTELFILRFEEDFSERVWLEGFFFEEEVFITVQFAEGSSEGVPLADGLIRVRRLRLGRSSLDDDLEPRLRQDIEPPKRKNRFWVFEYDLSSTADQSVFCVLLPPGYKFKNPPDNERLRLKQLDERWGMFQRFKGSIQLSIQFERDNMS